MFRPVTIVLFVLLGCLTGCGSGETTQNADNTFFPATGRVLVGKQPLAGVVLEFKPKFEWKKDVAFPHATTGSDGTFELETIMAADGAPAGDYEIGLKFATAEGDSSNASLGTYSDPAKSGLKATIKAAPTKIPDIVVKGSGIRTPASGKSRAR
jgi:hypothetical protein